MELHLSPATGGNSGHAYGEVALPRPSIGEEGLLVQHATEVEASETEGAYYSHLFFLLFPILFI